ncbi:MAG: hypothetical protein ACW99G_00565 [Candidatus Thorarchaeota archaeon]|jgi:hypothetical protein
MRIKKKHQNEYLLTEDEIWVRNPYRVGTPIDINNLSTESDKDLFIENENYIIRSNKNITGISNKPFLKKNVVIVSDGYDFSNIHIELGKLPYNEVTIMGTNRSLVNWNLIKGDVKRAMDFYVVNNPYDECLKYIPTDHHYYPQCIMSTRTSRKFAYKYPGKIKYYYTPVSDESYSGCKSQNEYKIDDYRNPICAAMGLALRFGVKKLLLFGCDDSFDTKRPFAVPLENGLWTYPQHLISHNIMNSILHWYKMANIKTGYHCHGPKFKNSEYIELEDIHDFFFGE